VSARGDDLTRLAAPQDESWAPGRARHCARMADYFPIDLPYPRTLDMKTHEDFGACTRRIYRLLNL
jgi:hypothetical protein